MTVRHEPRPQRGRMPPLSSRSAARAALLAAGMLLAFVFQAAAQNAPRPRAIVRETMGALAGPGPFDPPPMLRVQPQAHAARINALAFSPAGDRLYSTGEDKFVAVWQVANMAAKDVMMNPTLLQRSNTWRWEIQRGPRGVIDAAACNPQSGVLAVAGYSARDSNGDIARFTPGGELLPAWKWRAEERAPFREISPGHHTRVKALAWSGDGRYLASLDHSGQAFVWSSAQDDRPVCQLGPAVYPKRSGFVVDLAMLRDDTVALPEFAYQRGNDSIFQIHFYAGATGADTGTLPLELVRGVTTLAATADGQYLAVGDLKGDFWLVELRTKQATKLSSDAPVVCAAFSPNGKHLAGGTVSVGGAPSYFRVWNVATRQVQRESRRTGHLVACACSNTHVAYAVGGRDLAIETLDWNAGEPVHRTSIYGEPDIEALAFAGGQGPERYDVLFRRSGKHYHLQSTVPQISPAAVNWPVANEPEWSLTTDDVGRAIRCSRGGRNEISLTLDYGNQGKYRAHAWVRNAQREIAAVAIGTDTQNGIYVYRLSNGELLRYFRGHEGAITALACSADDLILASAARDATVRYWSLAGVFDPPSLMKSWGADVAVRDGRALVTAVHDLGPMYQRGVRAGDVITTVASGDGVVELQPDFIVNRLRAVAADSLKAATYLKLQRGAITGEAMVSPAWQQLLVAYYRPHEWVMGTPAGYYACSAPAEEQLGWQVNYPAPGRAPDYFTAAQFRDRFYRPDVIRRLLDTGSLERSLAVANAELQGNDPRRQAATTIAERRPPEVAVMNHNVAGNMLTLTAEATPYNSDPVDRMQLVIDGVPWTDVPPSKGVGRAKTQTWRVALLKPQQRVQVWAYSAGGERGESPLLDVACTMAPIERPGQLYVLAIGVSSYKQGRISLAYAHADAVQLCRALKGEKHDFLPANRRMEPKAFFADVIVRTVLNEQATHDGIRDGLRWLRDVAQPQDTILVYYSGHGFVSEAGGFYLIPHEGDPKRVEQTCVRDTLLYEELTHVKAQSRVVMLDACHSGAVEVGSLVKHAHLNSAEALRGGLANKLSRSVILVSSASSQVSFEHPDLKHGLFSAALLQGLSGEADIFPVDTAVDTAELQTYVGARVNELVEKYAIAPPQMALSGGLSSAMGLLAAPDYLVHKARSGPPKERAVVER